MSTPSQAASASVSSAAAARLPNWLREPLLHFVVLGGVLFVADHFIAGGGDDENVILVDGNVDGEARRVFESARGRPPNDDELYALRQVWLDNEVLYREGLALQVDKGDPAIRDRVIFKALSVIDASVQMPPVTEEMLEEWFESHRDQYDEPTRCDFEEAVLAGDRSEAAAIRFAQALEAGQPGDAQAGLRVFSGRPLPNLEQSYGPAFSKALTESPLGEWRALSSKDGWHVVRLKAITPSKPADFESLRGVLLQDSTDATMAEKRTAAVRALARKYTVKVARVAP